jgi:hypothetical protein
MKQISTLLVCLVVFALPGLAAESAPNPVVATWVQHEDAFDYFGQTSLFSCSSIEDHVKAILLHVGARKDAHVVATGCPNGDLTPGRSAFVSAKFYTLAPAQSGGGSGTVSAQWTALDLSARHPYFVSDGDCELFMAMKDFLPRNFSMRDVQYTTRCVPHDVSINSFSVKAEVLSPVPVAKVSRLTQ